MQTEAIYLHPEPFERLGAVFPHVDAAIEIIADGEADPATVRVRMKPGERTRKIVAVSLALGYRVQVSWWNPQDLAEWLEQQVAERRNLGPHTLKAAGCKAAGYSAEETARFCGWANATADLNLRSADDRLSAGDWKDLERAADLWDERSVDADHIVEFEPQALPNAS